MEQEKNLEGKLYLSKIQQKLDAGLTTTNQYAVKKRLKKNNSLEQVEAWSSWCTDGKNKFLAVLMPLGNVKLLTPEKLKKYSISGAK